MKRLSALITCALVPAAIFAATAGARAQAPSGDTCTSTGSGSAYTVNITVAGGTQQYGVAFNAPGAKVTNVSISGRNGGFTGGNLANGTTGAWVSDAPLTGSLVATVTVNGAVNGGFTIVPAGQNQSTYYDPVTCTTSKGSASAAGSGARNLAFTASVPTTVSTSKHGMWHLVAKVPSGGTLAATQLRATVGTSGAKPATSAALIRSGRVVAKSAGTVTLDLQATSGGQAALRTTGVLKVHLQVTFVATDGKSGHRTLNLTLRATA